MTQHLLSFSGHLFLASFRKLAVVVLGLLLLMPGSARAESYDIYKWCVTYYVNSSKPHPAGKFETVVAVERIQKCNYLRGAPESQFTGEQYIPGGPDLADLPEDLSCKDLGLRKSKLEQRRMELQAALQDAQAAMQSLEDLVAEARSSEMADDRAWLSARGECSRASALMNDLVRAVWQTECKDKRGEALVECKEAIFERTAGESLGTRWQAACSAEDAAKTRLETSSGIVDRLEADHATVRADILDMQDRIAALSTAIRNIRIAQTTCTD